MIGWLCVCDSATVWNVSVLSPLLGVTWLFGVLAVSQQLIAFQYIFAVANTLQVPRADWLFRPVSHYILSAMKALHQQWRN